MEEMVEVVGSVVTANLISGSQFLTEQCSVAW